MVVALAPFLLLYVTLKKNLLQRKRLSPVVSPDAFSKLFSSAFSGKRSGAKYFLRAFSGGFLRRLLWRKSGRSIWCETWRKTLSPNFLRQHSPAFSGFLRAFSGFVFSGARSGFRRWFWMLSPAFSGFLRATFSKLSPYFSLDVFF